MGAITVAIMSCVESGAHVVAVDTCYGPTRTLLSDYLKRFGVKVTFVSGLSADEVIEAITPETTLIYLESPSSIIFRLQDIEAITKVARERGITTAIDNTYCTPVFSNPVQFGVDIV
ncbi:MAG: PLP-dependent transferase, partial [Rhodospirillales bacterium]|nr:PLP-dependent transferase [Rhodospirillales bacterium]